MRVAAPAPRPGFGPRGCSRVRPIATLSLGAGRLPVCPKVAMLLAEGVLWRRQAAGGLQTADATNGIGA